MKVSSTMVFTAVIAVALAVKMPVTPEPVVALNATVPTSLTAV